MAQKTLDKHAYEEQQTNHFICYSYTESAQINGWTLTNNEDFDKCRQSQVNNIQERYLIISNEQVSSNNNIKQ